MTADGFQNYVTFYYVVVKREDKVLLESREKNAFTIQEFLKIAGQGLGARFRTENEREE